MRQEEKVLCYRCEAAGHNPYENLAIEEFFTEFVEAHPQEKLAILYFWQNEDSVVFGRNQNIASECNLDKLQQLRVHPVRRKTGGGAVFHDLENLNFSLIVSRSLYDRQRSMEIIRDALCDLGLDASINGRNDILVNDCKVSGNAYSSKEHMALHHGTLLLSVNVEKMEQLLTVDQKKLADKGVRSVRSRVVNLKSIDSGLQVADYKRAITQQFLTCYGNDEMTAFPMTEEARERITVLTDFYASSEWIFGYSGETIKEIKERFSWGSCSILIEKTTGNQYKYHLYSDSLYPEAIAEIQHFIADLGQKNVTEIPSHFDDTTAQMCIDVLALIKEKG